jgi:hypothetical protein
MIDFTVYSSYHSNVLTKLIFQEGGLKQCKTTKSNVYSEITGVKYEPKGKGFRGNNVTKGECEG